MGTFAKMNGRAGIEISALVGDAVSGQFKILRIDLDTDTVSAPTSARDIRRSTTHERVKYGVTHEGEHSHQTLCEFNRIGCWVFRRRRSRQIGPYLAEPNLIIFGADNAEQSFRGRRAAIAAWLPLHEDKLDVVFDYRVGLIGFSEKTAGARNLIIRVRDLMPDDRRKVVETNGLAMFLDCRMERNNGVTAIVFST